MSCQMISLVDLSVDFDWSLCGSGAAYESVREVLMFIRWRFDSGQLRRLVVNDRAGGTVIFP